MRTIYLTNTHKPTKYKRIQNEYIQNGDFIEKYVISSTRTPGRLEIDESRWKTGRSLSKLWNIYDPELPQWIKKYADIPSISIEEYIHQLEVLEYTVYQWEEENLLAFNNNSIMVYVSTTWHDIIPLIKLYYNRKKINKTLIKQFENDWIQEKITYRQLLKLKKEIDEEKVSTQKRERIERILNDDFNPLEETNKLIQIIKAIIPKFKGQKKEAFIHLLSKMESTEPSKESYAHFNEELWSIQESK